MILDTIVARKREEVSQLLARGSEETEEPPSPPRGFTQALISHEGVAIIAEVKKASPSKGVICPDFDPAVIAESYKKGGASAVSVLTDESFFQGSLSYIPLVRSVIDLPVLRKDFIIHEAQIAEARRFGADAILLIAAILDKSQIRDYLSMAEELGMDVLTEVHDETELEKTLKAGCRLIGINNRNLQDFTVDLNTTFRLKKEIPVDIPVVSESGIRNRKDMVQLYQENVCAALVGETLMRAPDRAAALRELIGG